MTTGPAGTTGPGTPSGPGRSSGPLGAGRQLAPGGRSRSAADSGAHMVVCGDDGLAHRLAAELRTVYREQVTLVVPPTARIAQRPVVGRARTAAAFLDRMTAAVNRATGVGDPTAGDRAG